MDTKRIFFLLNRAEEIQRERNELLKEVSKEIGFDVSFSEDALMKEITDLAAESIDKQLKKEMDEWMKSLSL